MFSRVASKLRFGARAFSAVAAPAATKSTSAVLRCALATSVFAGAAFGAVNVMQQQESNVMECAKLPAEGIPGK